MVESWASSERVRRTMVANRSKNTTPELAIRSALHARGFRYRIHRRPIESVHSSADIVFTRQRIAVFVDGCFWHGCPIHFIAPKRNADYWSPKIEGNQDRDARTNSALSEAGWTVLRIWEHEPIDVAVARIVSALSESTKGT